MTAPMSDYLKASIDAAPRAPLTPNSTSGDAAAVVEIVALISDPAACKKRMDELQQAKSEAEQVLAEVAREKAELRKQAEDLAVLRAEHDRALAVDRENHIGRRLAEEQAMADKLKQAEEFFATLKITDLQPEATS
jgi:hypothetical protein